MSNLPVQEDFYNPVFPQWRTAYELVLTALIEPYLTRDTTRWWRSRDFHLSWMASCHWDARVHLPGAILGVLLYYSVRQGVEALGWSFCSYLSFGRGISLLQCHGVGTTFGHLYWCGESCPQFLSYPILIATSLHHPKSTLRCKYGLMLGAFTWLA